MNLVVSYGDLAQPGGYRTRVLGELQTLDRREGLDPFLLVFDRNPDAFERTFQSDIPHQVLHRSSAARFYGAIKQASQRSPIRVVHAHNLYSAALALTVRKRYGYKVVLDYHGRIPEEYVFLGKGGSNARRLLERLEQWCVRRADHAIVVSHKLAEYLIERYKVPQQKISVIPCCVDESTFRWDAAQRLAVRQSLNLSEKFVCAHLGSFFEWYDPELIVQVFQRIQSRTDSHLLVITGEIEKASAYLSARLPANTFTVRSATHEEVPGLLNASDLGLLLLRCSPNIQTASPAKFAEYLNSGLPVLITPDVGDFSEFVMKAEVGAVVVGPNAADELSFVDRVIRTRMQLGDKCMAAGRQLTWQAFFPTWSGIVSSG